MSRLYLGNLNYSSWSIRALLVARRAGLGLEEVIIPLDFEDTPERLRAIGPTARVPVLELEGDTIWESLAIIERLAELASPGMVWPEDAAKRAVARSVSAEMHAGFAALRSLCPVDIRSRHPHPEMTPALEADIARVDAIWSDCLARHGGPFLFGAWSAADAMYAPVVTRFRTYDLPMSARANAYSEAVFADPLMPQLEAEAAAEPWQIEYTATGSVGSFRRSEA